MASADGMEGPTGGALVRALTTAEPTETCGQPSDASAEGREAHGTNGGGVGNARKIDLVVELRNSIGLVTRKAYRSSQALFLLHLYNENHPSLLPSFREAMTELLNGPRAHRGVTRSALISTLLPGFSQGEPIEPLDWALVDEMAILDPVHALKMDGGKLSDSRLSKYRSALSLLFKDFQQEQRWAELVPTIGKVLLGWSRANARKRKEEGMEVESGKAPLPFKLYVSICKDIAMQDVDGPFAWCYSTLMWNLVCRSDNVAYLNIGHVRVEDDHLLIFFAQSKTDQEGKLAKHGRAVFANPLNPWICPWTSLGIFLMTVTHFDLSLESSSTPPLFHGSLGETARRFRNCLMRSVERLKDEVEACGLRVDSIGSHSFRKGAATYLSSGGTACPSTSAISLRAGWTQPGVEGTYRQFDSAGDHHVGRTVCGLPMHTEELALLPPTFITRNVADGDFIRCCAVECMDIAKTNFAVAQRCLASVVFHLETLKSHLPTTHKLWTTPLMLDHDRCRKLKRLIYCGYEYDEVAKEINLRVTGVPPHCTLLHEMQQVRNDLDKVIPHIKDQMDRLPGVIEQALDDAVQQGKIEGQPVTTANLEACMARVLKDSGIGDLIHQQQTAGNENGEGEQHRETLTDFGLLPFAPLPSHFRVPNMSLRKAWHHWTLGDSTTGGRPWRLIQPNEVCEQKNRERLKRFRKLMLAMQTEVPQGEWKNWATFEEYEAMFDSIQHHFKFDSSSSLKRRHGELSWDTILRLKYKMQRSA